MKLIIRVLSALFVVLVALSLSAGMALAHGKLKSSIPAAGSTVATAPQTVTVAFDNHDPLNASASLLKVTDASGAVVDSGNTSLDKADAERKTLTVSLKSGLGNGTYTVAWKAVSEGDNSTEEGTFTFTVGAAPATMPATGGTDMPMLTVVLALLLFGVGVAARRMHTSRS